ncbi:MAG: DOMON domain-containing protein [Bacteroidia bacterium]
MSSITKNDMTVRWEQQGEFLRFELEAPTQGWLAIGFNPKDQLAHTQLIMACVEQGKPKVEDFWVLAPGDYRPVSSLQGKAATTQVEGKESTRGTTMSFYVPIQAVDRYHYDLHGHTSFNLLMAYSQSDDFMHHSIMRTSVTVSLLKD